MSSLRIQMKGQNTFVVTTMKVQTSKFDVDLTSVLLVCVVVVLYNVLESDAQRLYTKILPPVTSVGDEVALITAPGGYINGEAYEPLGYAIQKATSSKLWVGLMAGFRGDLVNPVSLKKAVYLAISDLQAAGMSKTTPVYVAGHSVGGMRPFIRLLGKVDFYFCDSYTCITRTNTDSL